MGDRDPTVWHAMPAYRRLHDPGRDQRDACGIGFVADASGAASRALLDTALSGLEQLRHRGALAADARTGDGAGLLFPFEAAFFEADSSGGELAPHRRPPQHLDHAGHAGIPPARGAEPGRLGVAMAFLDAADPEPGRRHVAAALAAEGLELLRWRVVPVRPEALGEQAQASAPRIEQALFTSPEGGEAGERRCFRASRRAALAARAAGTRLYLASCSLVTVTYKALCAADQLAAFYPDLADPRLRAPLAVFHQRYATNTFPSWERAQPFRFLAHNGEINTIDGNTAWMRAREGGLGAGELAPEELLRPVLDADGSDSTKLDNAVELLVRGGRDVRHALAMLVPAAVEHDRAAPEELRDFYRYHACLSEPWDGPAGLVFTDGRVVGAALDRNGLRPLRWEIGDSGLVVCASEAGAVDAGAWGGHTGGRVRRGRLGPGQMLAVDPGVGVLLDDGVKTWLAGSRPWSAWVGANLRSAEPGAPVEPPAGDLAAAQVAHGFTRELVSTVLRPMATGGKEPTASMGDDTPPAVLARTLRPVSHYLRQRFAQVTNPPIDHLRERHVLSKRVLLGRRAPLLAEGPEAAALVELPTFLLTPAGVAALVEEGSGLDARVLDATWDAGAGAGGEAGTVGVLGGPPGESSLPQGTAGTGGLRDACRRLGDEAEAAVRSGATLLVLSDHAESPARLRCWGGAGSPPGRSLPVPSLLAVGAVRHRLVAAGLATRASLVVETGEPVDSHLAAALLGYGADALCPWLALATVAGLGEGSVEAQGRYRHAVEEGVFKIMSKMGISTVAGYRGAQIFEALGLDAEVVDTCFTGTASPLGGIGFEELGADVLARAEAAASARLDHPGWFKHRPKAEYHATNPQVMQALQHTVRDDAEQLRGSKKGAHLLRQAVSGGEAERYGHFARLVNEREPAALRDLLETAPAGPPVPLDEVEPSADVMRRFSTAAMSLGALSPEAHETLAVALNRVGGRSNSGEGGEDPARFGGERSSAIKQVASGRFGVTPEYLVNAEELQIKMAQGSKPGEGGQLPGHKVSAEIARLRHTQPGVALISPPPHHDIYSIEDLAQLVFDLRQVNPDAEVSVKLVAEAGVGTVAAGVAKSLADAVTVSGAEGGTGASPLSSIKHAGTGWELGLAETQQALVASGLRARVKVRVDGGLKTGRDVLLAALLGADEYGFGTAALLAEGCLMVRTCHQDNCPVGIATQRPELRAKFAGTPEMVVRYLELVSGEVRELLAGLGLRSLDEAVGRVELLRQRRGVAPRADRLDLAPLLARGSDDPAAPRSFLKGDPATRTRSALGDRIAAEALPALLDGDLVHLRYPVASTDRTVGARLGGAVAAAFGSRPPAGRARIELAGAAGQSFGAFLVAGVDLRLAGPANDYVGKGMAGGRLVISPPPGDAGDPVLVGNTALYGATGGELFCAGRAGERFAVRNSGATAVVEGVGDHAGEYMTGGTVVVLGPAGRNVGAGMTGGELYLDEDQLGQVNDELVLPHRPSDADLAALRALLAAHAELTGSERAKGLLAGWSTAAARFWRVAPRAEVAAIEQAHEGTG